MLFDLPCAERWAAGMQRLGIAPAGLSLRPGHA
jgi:putative AlgH/UPF0301 family transcriptional regulator